MHRYSTVALLMTLGLAAGMTADGCNLSGGLSNPLRPAPTLIGEAEPASPGLFYFYLDLSLYPDALFVNYDFGDGSTANGLRTDVAGNYQHLFLRSGDVTVQAYLFNGQRQALTSVSTVVTVMLPAPVPLPPTTAPATEPATQPGTQPSTQPDNTRVRLRTTLGDIVLKMETAAAPGTVANFLQYVDEGHYNNVVFHRVVPGFVIQGGAFTSLGAGSDPRLTEIAGRPPIQSEANNGLSNIRATLSMALRGMDANSATDQFFINLGNNSNLDAGPPPFTVFATVMEGMEVVDMIAQVQSDTFNVQTLNGTFPFENVPVVDVVITEAVRLP